MTNEYLHGLIFNASVVLHFSWWQGPRADGQSSIRYGFYFHFFFYAQKPQHLDSKKYHSLLRELQGETYKSFTSETVKLVKS